MRNEGRIAVIIPALNEEKSIGKVLDAIPAWVDDVIVADNGSRDGTVAVAQAHGARTVAAGRRGYGSACLKGIAALDNPDVVVFLDGDYSDYPEQMDRVADPILEGRADLVIGSRVLGNHERGALTPQARFGNRLACFLIRLFWGIAFTDLGPFRAIRYDLLERMGMRDPDYGWTVEMQIKAILQGAPVTEVPVDYRKRIGKSKVSGTLRGVVGAGYKILWTIFWSALRHRTFFSPRRLIVFTRYPEPGKTKTRLIPALGEVGAAELQRQMTEHVLGEAAALDGTGVEVLYADGSESKMRAWLGQAWTLRPQVAGGLGERMCAAFERAFRSRVRCAVIIGVDCPEISRAVLEGAFEALRRNDVVLGPATDGGYYLVGLRRRVAARALPVLFDDVPWGTSDVFEKTVSIAREQRLRLARLATLDDVDRPEDLDAWARAQPREQGEDTPGDITVVIPTLNEIERVPQTIIRAQEEEGVEILVVDGGSADGTPEAVQELGVTVIPSPKGRAAQMNLGAARARGSILIFLHADTLLPEGYAEQVREVLGRPGVVAGAFRFGTHDPGPAMRFIGWWANQRSRWLRMPYGDQALFLRKDDFRGVGGYAELPIMEDFDVVRRLARKGTIALAPASIATSGRRWKTQGHWRTMIRNQLVVAAYLLGVSPERIARFYERHRGISA